MRIVIFLISLLSLNVYSTPPDNKIRADIESFVSKYVETLESEGVVRYISVVEILHVDKNIERDSYGLIYWQDPNNKKFSSLYITNKCRKLSERCKLSGLKVEYDNVFLLVKPELDFLFKYFNAFKNELLNTELINIKEADNISITPLPFKYLKINLNTEIGHLSTKIEKYKFYARMDIECKEYIMNSKSVLFPLMLMIENIKNETLIHGSKTKL